MDALRTGTRRSRVRLQRRELETASGGLRTHAEDERTREVGPSYSTEEPAEQRRGTGRGGGGGKGTDQGELARAYRAPDAEPGRRAQRARASTTGGTEGQTGAVHRALPPRVCHRPVTGRVLRLEAGGGGRDRRRNVAALRRGPGYALARSRRTAATRGVPREARAESGTEAGATPPPPHARPGTGRVPTTGPAGLHPVSWCARQHPHPARLPAGGGSAVVANPASPRPATPTAAVPS